VRVNEAHQRLKDPLSRATYLCELAGHAPDNAVALPPQLLARQMDWHETIAEAPSADAVRAVEAEVASRLRTIHDEVRADLDDRSDPAAAAPKLREWMFLMRLNSEIERRLEAMEA
jgi:molecular chaperone HscB